MDPGPADHTVLSLQDSHRSTAIWNGEEYGTLSCRHHLRVLSSFPVPQAVTDYVTNTQFSGIGRLCYVPLDVDLITALVERWRQETHTFHFPFGEATVTLQDVAVLFGLRVSGRPVTGSSDHNWVDLCEELLGLRPSNVACKGSKLKLVWLHDNFQNLPNNSNEVRLHQYVRAYLLYLIGAVLFPDKTGNTVSLIYLPLLRNLNELDDISWGSGVLCCLYRNLCKACLKEVWQIAGPLLLLQVWSWERIAISRAVILKSKVVPVQGQNYPLGTQFKVGTDPLACKWIRIDRLYKDHKLGVNVVRDLFDKMAEFQFVWQPYTRRILQFCSPRCIQDQDQWLVIAPLIWFEAVEFHLPERCTRQFGWHQIVPPGCNTCTDLHSYTRKGDGARDYAQDRAFYIQMWDNRMEKTVQPGTRYSGMMSHDDPYLEWFKAITRLVIGPMRQTVYDDYEDHHYYYPTAADYQTLTESNVYTYNTSRRILDDMPDDFPLRHCQAIEKMNAMSLNALRNTNQGHLVNYEEPVEQTPSPPRYNFRHLQQRLIAPTQESIGESSNSRKGKSKRKA